MGATSKILIAEDNAISQLMLRKILSSNPSYEVEAAGDGESTWNLLQAGAQPDLLILDVMMPQLNGLDLLRRIRADSRLNGLRVMLCSALRDRETIRQGADLGIKYYILKPFQTALILEQVARALGHSLKLTPAGPSASIRPGRPRIVETIGQAVQLLRTAAGPGCEPHFPQSDIMLRAAEAWPAPSSQRHLQRIMELAREIERENEQLEMAFAHPAMAPLPGNFL